MPARDLQFDIVGNDKTAAAFRQAEQHAREFTGALDGQSRRAFESAVQGSRRFSKAVNDNKFQTANLAAQINDIGVQLASGTSPFLIAIQQGSQINQVLGDRGARGAVAALGGAFASMINPVSLATFAIIAASGAAVQYFSKILSDGEKSAAVLKEESELIQQVAKKWGDAYPALKAYADERQRIADMEEKKQAFGIAVADQYKSAKASVTELNLAVADQVVLLQQAGAEQDEIVSLQRAWESLQAAVDKNAAKAEDATAVQSALMKLFINTGIPATGDLAAEFYRLATAIGAAEGAAKKLTFEELLGKSVLPDFAKTGVKPIYSAGGKFIDEEGLQTARANAAKSQFQKEMEASLRGARKPREERDKYREVMQALAEEREMIGLNAREQKILIEQRKAGVSAASVQGQAIRGVVTAIDLEREAFQRAVEAQKEYEQSIMYVFGSVGDTLMSIVDKSEKASDALAKLAVKFTLAAAQAALFNEGPLAGIFGGLFGGGGFTPNTTAAAFFGAFDIPGNAKGTMNWPGGLSWVGEQGKELVNLPRGSQVFPADLSRQIAAGAGGGGGAFAPSMTINIGPNAQAGVRAEVEAAGKEIMKQMRAEFTGRTIAALRTIKKNGISV